jgi:hypothetical protein
MPAHDTQSFFTPDEYSCLSETLLSKTYNLAHILLNRSQSTHLFIPIRSMQYLAIIEKNMIWFVDSLTYAVRDNEGGRLITVSWQPILSVHQRNDLNEHVPCHVIFYGGDRNEVHKRLRSEFYVAMGLIDQRYRKTSLPGGGAKILSLKPGDSQI